LKDLRHLFLTTLSNAGLSEPYRQYLAGQAMSNAPVMSYTHLDQVREQYIKAIDAQWPALITALERRIVELKISILTARPADDRCATQDSLHKAYIPIPGCGRKT